MNAPESSNKTAFRVKKSQTQSSQKPSAKYRLPDKNRKSTAKGKSRKGDGKKQCI